MIGVNNGIILFNVKILSFTSRWLVLDGGENRSTEGNTDLQ